MVLTEEKKRRRTESAAALLWSIVTWCKSGGTMCATLDVLDIRGLVKNFSAFDCCSKHAPRTANRSGRGGEGRTSYTRNETERWKPEDWKRMRRSVVEWRTRLRPSPVCYTVENKAEIERSRKGISSILLALIAAEKRIVCFRISKRVRVDRSIFRITF